MNQWDVIDYLNVLSFAIGLANYEENLTQNDKADLENEFSEKADMLLKEIHAHLERQDAKIDYIIRRLDNDST